MPALPQGFKVAQYFSLLAEYDPALTPPGAVAEPAQPPGELTPETSSRFTPVDAQQLYLSLIAADAGTQEGLAEKAQLEPGRFLSKSSLDQLLQRVVAWLDEAKDDSAVRRAREVQLLNGLQYLAPFIGQGESQPLWALVANCVDLQTEPNPKLRALWGDVRSALGCDPRFEAGRLCLAVKDVEDLPTNFNTKGDDIPGFAKIDARGKPFWFGDGGAGSGMAVTVPGLGKVFYIARTLTTVDQYKAFVDSEDYAASFQGEGHQWLTGDFDSKVTKYITKVMLDRRPPADRARPYEWQSQLKNPLRPVVHVSWFEANAYARWLETQLPIFSYGKWRASLPTEEQWECSARFGMAMAQQPSPYPWAGGPAANAEANDFAQLANLGELVGAPTTVGIYPQGHSPERLADMVGNVLEWSTDHFVSNFNPARRIAKQNATRDLPLRGGSWILNPSLARCSVRDGSLPNSWGGFIGFRVVLSMAD